jgi:hypothetical protein
MIKVWYDLGLINVFRVGLHKIQIKLGVHSVQRISGTIPAGKFFEVPINIPPPGAKSRITWSNGMAYYFGRPLMLDKEPPDWLSNPFKKTRAPSQKHWWKIPDFDENLGDIKTVWEASRFDWIIPFAQRAVSGNKEEITKLNNWLISWSFHNPAYIGVNWKCAQEASIRVLQLSLALLILGQTNSATHNLLELIKIHLRRIRPTLGYAIGQANNHGTSEAAALYVGGSLLAENDSSSEAKKWEQLGQKWMENRIDTLISKDGSFSQYSVTYHRFMMDTCNLVEIWRKHLNRPRFSTRYIKKMRLATNWLMYLIDPETGDAPNLGANDGSRLMVLCDSDYRDFRPTCQVSTVLFEGCKAYDGDGLWNQALIWTGIDIPENRISLPESISFDEGGLHVLRKHGAVAFLKYPRYQFRPRQSDALHCDLWIQGKNIARDAGSFSYNFSSKITEYFNGTKAHNTVQFDDRDQMQRISRFLFGDWLRSKDVELVSSSKDSINASASYCDKQGAFHKRTISLFSDKMICSDDVSGFNKKAVLRWRLCSGEWILEDNLLVCGDYQLKINSNIPIVHMHLTKGEESRYYMEKKQLPVFEIEVHQPAIIETCFIFSKNSEKNLSIGDKESVEMG